MDGARLGVEWESWQTALLRFLMGRADRVRLSFWPDFVSWVKRWEVDLKKELILLSFCLKLEL